MIKNIVFDMGQVLVSYVGKLVCQIYIEDEQERKDVSTSVFASPEWVLLDMGVMPEEEALKKMQERLDTERKREQAEWCFWHWHEYNMKPKEGMEELVRWLKSMGYGIYLCSNASVRLLKCYKEVIPAIDCFDGILISSEEGCKKPCAAFFTRLLERYGLDPARSIMVGNDEFSDIAGAVGMGMDSLYLHTATSPQPQGKYRPTYCVMDGDWGKVAEILLSGKQRKVALVGDMRN